MGDTLLSPDIVATAAALVEKRKAELEAARAKARTGHSRNHWLADRPDLLRLDQLISDYPHRQSRLSVAKGAYQEAYRTRLAEKQRNCPFQVPAELAGQLNRLRWLTDVLNALTDLHLESLLNDARLDDTDRANITARIKANRARWVPLYVVLGAWKLPAGGVREATVTGGSDAEWARYRESVIERRRSLERELDEQRQAHDNALCCDVERELHSLKEVVVAAQSALSEAAQALPRQQEIDDYVDRRIKEFVDAHTHAEQTTCNAAIATWEEALREARRQREAKERAWWEAMAMHPIAAVVERLPNVPTEHVGTVIARLLRLPPTDPHIHSKDVHQFLLAHQEFADGLTASAPVVVAAVSCLIAEGNEGAARALLEQCPTAEDSLLAGMVAYLRYVLREVPDLSGVTAYRSLTADDLFLGACYWGGDAAAMLQRQSQWEYPALERAPGSGSKDGDTKHLNNFKVRGLQPRIAELAFREVVRRLRGLNAAQGLRDLNAERIASLPLPRTLASRPILPSADWAEADGWRYDVKCNIFYPSKREAVGLRGFLIELDKPWDRHCSYPAFVLVRRPMSSAGGSTSESIDRIPQRMTMPKLASFRSFAAFRTRFASSHPA